MCLEGIKINVQKNEPYLVVGGDGRGIELPGLGAVMSPDRFKYLDSIIHSSGTCKADIARRIQLAGIAMRSLNGLLCSREIDLRHQEFDPKELMVESILVFGSEGQSLTQGNRQRLCAVELDGLSPQLGLYAVGN